MSRTPCIGAALLLLTACGSMDVSVGMVEAPPVLLFAGTGTSPNDVKAVEQILIRSRLPYTTARSRQLDAMQPSELAAYRLVIVPGGNFEQLGNGISAETTTRLRAAIGGGVNYLGICAGAFFAGASPYNGLDLTSGARFPFYALEDRGIRKSAVPISTADGPTLDHYWEDGPQLTGWGEPVARYPDGTPAVVQGSYGKGWVVLTGVHPEAPESWRAGIQFGTSADLSHAYAARLVDAALNRTRLPHY